MSTEIIHARGFGEGRACDRSYRDRAAGKTARVTDDPREITCKTKSCQDKRQTYETTLQTAARTTGLGRPTYGFGRDSKLEARWTLPHGEDVTATITANGLAGEWHGSTIAELEALQRSFDAAAVACSQVLATMRQRERFARYPRELERYQALASQGAAK